MSSSPEKPDPAVLAGGCPTGRGVAPAAVRHDFAKNVVTFRRGDSKTETCFFCFHFFFEVCKKWSSRAFVVVVQELIELLHGPPRRRFTP